MAAPHTLSYPSIHTSFIPPMCHRSTLPPHPNLSGYTPYQPFPQPLNCTSVPSHVCTLFNLSSSLTVVPPPYSSTSAPPHLSSSHRSFHQPPVSSPDEPSPSHLSSPTHHSSPTAQASSHLCLIPHINLPPLLPYLSYSPFLSASTHKAAEHFTSSWALYLAKPWLHHTVHSVSRLSRTCPPLP